MVHADLRRFLAQIFFANLNPVTSVEVFKLDVNLKK